jgi:hypothetical protein
MSFIGNEPDTVGPSIIVGTVSFVVILTTKLPAASELVILPISNLMNVPAGTLTGLLTVYIKVVGFGADNEPEPMPLFSINLVAIETSKPDGKDISIVFIVPVVTVLKKISYIDLVFTMLFDGTTATFVSAAASAGLTI